MGTCSFLLTGTDKGMEETFGSTCQFGQCRAGAGQPIAALDRPVLVFHFRSLCSAVRCFFDSGHGAGRAMSRNKSRRALDYKEVLEGLAEKGISIRVASPKLVMEEAPESYKVRTSAQRSCNHYPRHFLSSSLLTLSAALCVCAGCDRGGGDMSRRGHQQEVHQAETHRSGQGMREGQEGAATTFVCLKTTQPQTAASQKKIRGVLDRWQGRVGQSEQAATSHVLLIIASAVYV